MINGTQGTVNYEFEKSTVNLAIVGGGKACKFFLELIRRESFPYLNVNLVGVCDTNPDAEGIHLANEMGIYTTDNFRDLFNIENLDGIIELTNNRKVLLELIRNRPERVGVLEHNIGRFIRRLYDIDQQLRSAKQEVALERMASDFLIQQTNDRIVVLEPDFTIVEANEAYLNAVAKTKMEVIGAHCYEITHGLNAPCSVSHPELGCPMVETLRTGEFSHVIHEHPDSGEGTTFCDMVTYPIKDHKGNIIRIIEIWRDITKELSSRWEERVRTLKDDYKKLIQEDRMISLGKLVASCVHEINNPIQGLLTFSHLMRNTLEEGDPDREDLEKFRKFLPLMCGELERCGDIISGLLSFSREPALGFKDVDLNEVLAAVIALTRHKMELQNIKLITEICPRPLLLQGDMNQLQQCFLNLVFNAIEAMPGGGEMHIMSAPQDDDNKIRIEIRDTGCGIREENMEHIFDPFFLQQKARGRAPAWVCRLYMVP